MKWCQTIVNIKIRVTFVFNEVSFLSNMVDKGKIVADKLCVI